MLLKPIPIHILPTPPDEEPGGSCSTPECPNQAQYEILYHSPNHDGLQPPRTLLLSCEKHLECFLESNFNLIRLPDFRKP